MFLYGALATRTDHVERANIRAGGPAGAGRATRARRDSNPTTARTSCTRAAGATLVTARPPLIAFNVDLRTDDVELAKRIAARLRESGGGAARRPRDRARPPRARARAGLVQRARPPGRAAAPTWSRPSASEAPIAEAELVGLAPAAAFDGFPPDVPLRDFDPEQHLIENALDSVRNAMAQKKRKRKSRHRGTAAGTVEARGRTSRPTGERKTATTSKAPAKPANREEARQVARERRAAKFDEPPTWRGALNRAMFAAALFGILIARPLRPADRVRGSRSPA